MTTTTRLNAVGLAVAVVAVLALTPARAQTGVTPALPSWNEGPSKRAIVAFVKRVTKLGAPEFVRAGERIAVFGSRGGRGRR